MVKLPQSQVLALVQILLLIPRWVKSCSNNEECQNGGMCASTTTDAQRQCICAPGFWRFYCEETCELTCQNGGQCAHSRATDHGGNDLESGEVICKCPAGYEGPLCSVLTIDESTEATSSPITNPNSIYTASSSSSSSPSAVTKVGSVVGVAVCSILVAYLVWKFLAQRQRKRQDNKNMKNNNNINIAATTMFSDDDDDPPPSPLAQRHDGGRSHSTADNREFV
jgi:hypothetical protein